MGIGVDDSHGDGELDTGKKSRDGGEFDTGKKLDSGKKSSDDDEPYIGRKFNTPDELYVMYKAYAKQVGFAVRKRSHRKNEEGIIISISYVCNRQGNPPNGGKNPAKPQKSHCCGCKAYVTARLDDEDKWEITQLALDHNHLLSPSKSRHYRCHRKVNPHVRHRLDLNDQSGIRMHKNYLSMVNEAGGYDNIECSEKDYRNAIEEIRRLRLGEGDAAALMKYFLKKVRENVEFYFAIDYDEEDRLRNVFWADGWSREAYKEFGEVVSFDTTYLTNKYDMPFAPFVGVNHHGQSILLGCGLLSNETTETFLWLFKKWLKCMYGCAPKAIITDQDKAMQNAVGIIFPEARHRWCLWHVMKKVPEKFGKYTEKEKIIFALKEVVYDSQTPAEFEECWRKMVDKYNLEQNKWLNDLYDERQRWIPCFVKNTFWAGMSTTQRSESMNAFFDGFVHSKTTLKQFVEQYEQALRKKVEKERKEDSFSKSIPTITKYPFEKQIQEIYTLAKYREFQAEIVGKIGCELVHINEGLGVSIYVIREDIWLENFCKKVKFCVTFHKTETYEDSSEENKDDEDIVVEAVSGVELIDLEQDDESETKERVSDESETEERVYDESETEERESDERGDETEATKAKKRKKRVDFDVHCSCQMFEFRGILCRHAIMVLIRNGIRLITEQYILRRWRKDVKRSHTKVKVSFSCWELNKSSLRYNQMCMKFSDVADLASGSDEQCKVVNEWLDDKMKELTTKPMELEKAKVDEEVQGDEPASKVRDPLQKKRKGRPRSTRLEAKRKTKTSTKSSQDVIITDTPEFIVNGMALNQESVATVTSTSRAPRGTYTSAPCGSSAIATRALSTRAPRGSHMDAFRVNMGTPYMTTPCMYTSVPLGTPYTRAPCNIYTSAPPGTPYIATPPGMYTSVPPRTPYMAAPPNMCMTENTDTPYENRNTKPASFLEQLLAPWEEHNEHRKNQQSNQR